jgi:RNA polymerase sigma factor (sigma-70 family)
LETERSAGPGRANHHADPPTIAYEGTTTITLLLDVTLVEPAPEAPMAADLEEARDRDLLRRIGRADEEAFRELFRRYSPTAMALARRVVRQPFIAEEIVQEAFLAAWRNAEGYNEGRGSVRSWLMTMVHHRAVDAVRREESQRRRAEDARAGDVIAVEDPADAVVAQLGLPEERRAVRAALGDLPAEQRQVIELMYFDGLSQSKVSERLGLPLGTVKSRTLLGMRRLRSSLIEVER